MSLQVDGTWKAAVWASTVWTLGVWYEPDLSITFAQSGGGGGYWGNNSVQASPSPVNFDNQRWNKRNWHNDKLSVNGWNPTWETKGIKEMKLNREPWDKSGLKSMLKKKKPN